MTEAVLLLFGATLAVLGSPGPAPLALAATGASFGPRRGLPFLVGVLIGLAGVAVLTALGVAALLRRGGPLSAVLLALSLGYFVYVAYKIASAPLNVRDGTTSSAAPTVMDGLVLNLTNPKAYAAIAALYAGFGLPFSPAWLSVVLTGGLVLLIGAVIDAAWLFGGGALAPLFANPRVGRPLRIGMAAFMLLAVGASLWFAAAGGAVP